MVQKIDSTLLKQKFSGTVILPESKLYEKTRVTYTVKNAYPAIILQAVSTEDIAAAIDFAKINHLKLSVRSGGHGVAGFGTNSDGIVLDVSRMNSIEVLNKETGLVRLGSGALWGDVAAQLAEHGLSLSSGDTKTVGVGGLTLGGGIGWMVRKYGYAIDSLVAAEVVLADGTVVRASEEENSDLFWALRGGGGNFGVVASFDFKAHPLGKVTLSTLTYAAENLEALVGGWRDYMRTAPEDLTSFMTLLPGFGGGTPMVMIMSCYASDDVGQANAAIEPLRRLGTLTNDDTNLVAYADVLQEAHPPAGLKFIVKNMFSKAFTNELVTTISDLACKPKSPIFHIRMMNGAASRVDPKATPIAHRDSEVFLFAGFGMPLDTSKDQEEGYLKSWERLAIFSSGAYGNFLSTSTKEDINEIYPVDTYQRLATIKRTYDPDNLFNQNFNIKPTKE